RSDFLYAQPSFLEGFARILDFGNTLNVYNESETGEDADETALWMDWGMVGSEMAGAAQRFGERGIGQDE
ncbi:MAG: hypothetical protein O3A47_12600, partial [Chloroflexi bacterium]|nr:hypothetical protein [Chloroflexota bacterium]